MVTSKIIHKGNYTCVARNEAGTDSRVIPIDLTGKMILKLTVVIYLCTYIGTLTFSSYKHKGLLQSSRYNSSHALSAG